MTETKRDSILDSVDELAQAIKGLETRVVESLTERTKVYRRIYPEVAINPTGTSPEMATAVSPRSELRATIESLTSNVRRIESYVADIAGSIE